MKLQLQDEDCDAYSSEHSSQYKDKVEYASDNDVTDEELKEEDVMIMEDEMTDERDDVAMDELENESLSFGSAERRRRKEKRPIGGARGIGHGADLGEEEGEDANTIFIDNLPSDEFGMRKMIAEAKRLVRDLEIRFFEEEDSDREEQLKQITNVAKHEEALQAFREFSNVKNFWCVPLSVDVRTFNFELLAKTQLEHGGRPFDVITCDPPWQLSTANPTRGVAISYDTLSDGEILKIPFDKLQPEHGFLLIWVINAKFRFALAMMHKYGYK